MATVRNLIMLGGLALSAATLSGCISSGSSSPEVAAAPRGVEGNWVSTDGVAVSRFSGGVFTTTALDTGNKLADGSYKVAGNSVSITVVSLIRNTTTNVNCAMVAQGPVELHQFIGTEFCPEPARLIPIGISSARFLRRILPTRSR